MNIMRAGLRPAFGILLIAFGWAQMLMPIDGWMQPENLARDFMPLIFFVVAVSGFVIGGLGMFGWRPFESMMRPAMVLAAAYSLVLIWRFGEGDLWWGAGIDAALFLIALTGVYGRLPVSGLTADRRQLHTAHPSAA